MGAAEDVERYLDDVGDAARTGVESFLWERFMHYSLMSGGDEFLGDFHRRCAARYEAELRRRGLL